jgi:uncharacterized FlaG/YvyC family protein
MKRKVQFITVAVLAMMVSSAGVHAQEGTQKSTDEKQKQAEVQKQAEIQKQAEAQKQAEIQKKQQAVNEEMKLKQAEIEAKRKEIQEKVAEIDALKDLQHDEMVWIYQGDQGKKTRQLYGDRPVVIMPDVPEIEDIDVRSFDNFYFFNGHSRVSKPGSSWNYSRQVMEATFTNEFTMSAGDERNVNLSVSGDCAEGSIVVAIIMPDGKQLSEVILDENGSLNWRKNFEAGDNNGWKNGKWTFRIKAKNATGNLRISMNSD